MRFLKYLFATALMFTACKNNADKHVYLLVKPQVAGDADQLRGLKMALQKEDSSIVIDEINLAETPDPDITVKEGEKTLVCAVGTYGLAPLQALKADHPSIMTAHFSHQVLDDHAGALKNDDHPSGVDAFVLPAHTNVDAARLSQTRLINVFGVSHTWTKDELAEMYNDKKDLFPKAPSYALVILGGDVEQPDKSWTRFSEKEAAMLSEDVFTNLDQDMHVIVAHGPRTGKHDKDMSLVKRDADDRSADAVSQSFVNTLGEKIGKNRVHFYHFKSEPKLKAQVGLIASSAKNKAYLPGESTSMLSQIADNLKPDQITIFTHPAMNDGHHAFIHQLETLKPDARIINLNTTRPEKVMIDEVPQDLARETAAKALLEMLR